jgi:hypothetical protein
MPRPKSVCPRRYGEQRPPSFQKGSGANICSVKPNYPSFPKSPLTAPNIPPEDSWPDSKESNCPESSAGSFCLRKPITVSTARVAICSFSPVLLLTNVTNSVPPYSEGILCRRQVHGALNETDPNDRTPTIPMINGRNIFLARSIGSNGSIGDDRYRYYHHAHEIGGELIADDEK